MTRAARIVMVSASFPPAVGGAEKQALELAKALAGLGVEVTVLTRRLGGAPARESVDGIEVRRLPAWGAGLLNAIVFMSSLLGWLLLHASEYETIHVHLAGSPAVSSALAGRLLGKQVLVKFGGAGRFGELEESAATAPGRLKLGALARLKPRFIAVTSESMKALERFGLSEGVLLLPNGVDARTYRPASAGEKASLRREWGIPDGVCFLFAGRLSEQKRLDALLDAFAAALPATGQPASLVLSGAGPLEGELRARAERLDLGDSVRFLPPSRDIAPLYRAADVFVLPSYAEGLSNALLEAMSSGLGVLASRVGGTPEAVEDGESGLLFDPESPAELRRNIERFMKEPKLAAKLGEKARKTIEERFDIRRLAEKYKTIYEEEPS